MNTRLMFYRTLLNLCIAFFQIIPRSNTSNSIKFIVFYNKQIAIIHAISSNHICGRILIEGIGAYKLCA